MATNPGSGRTMQERDRDPFATPPATSASYAAPYGFSGPPSPPLSPPIPGRPQHPFTAQRDASMDSFRDRDASLLAGGGYSAYAAPLHPTHPTHPYMQHSAHQPAYVPGRPSAEDDRRKRRWLWIAGVVGLVVVVIAVVIPVYFLVVKKHKDGNGDSGNGNSGSSSGGNSGTGTVAAVTGGDGSTVNTVDGGSFVYQNAFGGFWAHDPTNPFLNSAAPNSWTPPLNQSWRWGQDRIYGVNLGGWFVLEPFIVPALYQKYPTAPDEWELSTLMRADGTLESTMENHYNTFYTEEDFAQIAGAGLNWVRIPIPFWAISTWSDVGQDASGATVGEPFLEGACWKYIVRALNWARKYGLRVNLDIHTAPGSQNSYNHSGKLGQVNFLNGPMGIANAQRMLDYIRIIIEFVSQDEYKDLVPMVGIINEALLHTIGKDSLTTFYIEAHKMIRSITGVGEGNGPYISIHDGFDGVPNWAGFLTGSDRMILDAFSGQPNDEPVATSEDLLTAGGKWPKQACDGWGQDFKNSQTEFGITVAGEWSVGYNDCGFFLNGIAGGHNYPGDCSLFEDSTNWNASMKAGLKALALATMDATQDWFFWTWKIAPNANGVVGSPMWSYKLGLDNDWMPKDPRDSKGACAARGAAEPSFSGTYSSWQTGGAGAGTLAATDLAQFGVWPPTTVSHVEQSVMTALRTYTPTAKVTTLSYATPTLGTGVTAAEVTATPTVGLGDGWKDAADTAQAMTAVAGCVYPDAWGALTLVAPETACTGV
ncbi:Glycoside hydrolase family 5 protein [Mycena kentingensis (nom. inval.)]|nr:Glycoside hydrolase family 5 protein [Mycena kentingensis (nom. inval.)]